MAPLADVGEVALAAVTDFPGFARTLVIHGDSFVSLQCRGTHVALTALTDAALNVPGRPSPHGEGGGNAFRASLKNHCVGRRPSQHASRGCVGSLRFIQLTLASAASPAGAPWPASLPLEFTQR